MIPVYLLLLPAFVCSKIVVHVDLRSEPLLIDVSGHSEIPIPEKERLTFKLDNEQLKKSVANHSGTTPTDVFVRNDWGDLYKTYDWQEVRRIINPTLVTKTNPKYSIECTEELLLLYINTTVHSVWDNSTVPTNERTEYEIIYDREFKTIVPVNINSQWGKRLNEFHTNYFLPTFYTLVKCTVTLCLDYEATLSGDVAVNYSNKRNGSHFWKFDVNNVQLAAGLPTSLFYQENVTIEYYYPDVAINL